MINSASVINVPFLEMREQLDELAAGGTKFFHIDLMDGHYVPNLCMPIKLIRELKDAYPQIVMDVHIMVTNPQDYIEHGNADGGGAGLCRAGAVRRQYGAAGSDRGSAQKT